MTDDPMHLTQTHETLAHTVRVEFEPGERFSLDAAQNLISAQLGVPIERIRRAPASYFAGSRTERAYFTCVL